MISLFFLTAVFVPSVLVRADDASCAGITDAKAQAQCSASCTGKGASCPSQFVSAYNTYYGSNGSKCGTIEWTTGQCSNNAAQAANDSILKGVQGQISAALGGTTGNATQPPEPAPGAPKPNSSIITDPCNSGTAASSLTIASCHKVCGSYPTDTTCADKYTTAFDAQYKANCTGAGHLGGVNDNLYALGGAGSDCGNQVRAATEALIKGQVAPSGALPSTPCAPGVAGCTLNYQPLEPLPVALGQGGGDSSTLVGFLNYMFPILITLGAMTGVLFFTVYGIEYMLSSVVSTKVNALGHLKSVLYGMTLLIASVLILSTINPALLNLSVFNPDQADPPTALYKLKQMLVSTNGGGALNGGSQTIQTAPPSQQMTVPNPTGGNIVTPGLQL